MWKHTVPIASRHNRRVRVERAGAAMTVSAGYTEPLDGHPRVGIVAIDDGLDFALAYPSPNWAQIRSPLVPRVEVRRDGGLLVVAAQYRSSARGPAIDLLFDDPAGDFRFTPERDDGPDVEKISARAVNFSTT